jgi:hypothetical protein
MCRCKTKNCSEECLLKLKFINYINDKMIKNTNAGAKYTEELNCDNLNEIKNKLQVIIDTLKKDTEEIGTLAQKTSP